MRVRPWLGFLVFSGAIFVVCGKAQSGSVDAAPTPSHSVTITEEQNGQTVPFHKSDDVVVTFIAAGGTGYSWRMEPTELATAKEEDVPLKPGLPGGPVKMMFHVKAKQTVTLKFDFGRAWVKDKPPDKTFRVTLKLSE